MTTPKYQLIVIVIGLLTSCDPTYPISITNNRLDTVTVITETTIHFSFVNKSVDFEELGGTYDHTVIKFKMAPGTLIQCGSAIAGIQDEMPFTKFKVYSSKDSIVANSQDEILNLFEKTFWGSLKTPYNLEIK
jgi:hypothetical protein